MAEQSSDNEIGETSGMLEQSLYNQIAELTLTQARFEFAVKCLGAVMNLERNRNVIFSPYSIYEGLLRIYLASSDDTEKQLRCKLNLPDNDDIQKLITNWMLHTMERKNEHKKLPDYKEKNYCWITNTKLVTNMTQRLFKDKLEIVNFRKGYNCLTTWIYEFLKKKTEGYISVPVQLNNICKNMEIILLTVLCLYGNTEEVEQSVTTDSYDTQSLKIFRSFISTKLQVIVTELPFTDKNMSLFLLFPACKYLRRWYVRNGGIPSLVERLTTRKGIDELRNVLDSSERFHESEEVILPDSFEMENELRIDKLLDKLDIQNLLQVDQATLPKFTDSNLHFGDAIHRSYIKVTSEDVTAGAVNMFFTKKKALVKPSKNIKHSACRNKFLWLIYSKENHTILFIGSVNKQKSMASTVEHDDLLDKMVEMFK